MLLSPDGPTVVLWAHILAATIWIGGQITLGLLVPLLRHEPDLLAASARRFQWLAWAAYAALLGTGVLNVHNAGMSWSHLGSTVAGRTLMLKLLFVALSGIAAGLHAFVIAPRATTRRTRTMRAMSGILGSISLLSALAAALYGVTIAERG